MIENWHEKFAAALVQHIREKVYFATVVDASHSLQLFYGPEERNPGLKRIENQAVMCLAQCRQVLRDEIRDQNYMAVTEEVQEWFLRDGVDGRESPQRASTWQEALTITASGRGTNLVLRLRCLAIPTMPWPFTSKSSEISNASSEFPS